VRWDRAGHVRYNVCGMKILGSGAERRDLSLGIVVPDSQFRRQFRFLIGFRRISSFECYEEIHENQKILMFSTKNAQDVP
jgi:hypothetical protein